MDVSRRLYVEAKRQLRWLRSDGGPIHTAWWEGRFQHGRAYSFRYVLALFDGREPADTFIDFTMCPADRRQTGRLVARYRALKRAVERWDAADREQP